MFDFFCGSWDLNPDPCIYLSINIVMILLVLRIKMDKKIIFVPSFMIKNKKE